MINLHGFLSLFHVNLNSLQLSTDRYLLILITEFSINYGPMDSRPGMADHITCIPFTLSAFVNSLPGQKPTPKKNPISVKWAPHSRNENIYGHPSAKLGTFQTHRDARQCRESSGV